MVRELRAMLAAKSQGALFVAWDMLRAGQQEIRGDATILAMRYLLASDSKPADLRVACWVIRDFGTVEQFDRLVAAVRQSQYQDVHRYELLWNSIIWSDNPREHAVLDIMLKDQRIAYLAQKYSDIARGELARLQKIQ
jgi:hypothetical protein